MATRHEIKSQLAKLLATEDLVVEHKYIETACFDVRSRILTLPLWEKASSLVYDLLVGHEVGHALFTPDVDWELEYDIPKQFVNVVEDARIEKFMKRKYPGLSKTFYKGYNELSDEDFFCLENENVDSMNLADRANLYFKIGNFINIPFTSSEEKILIQKISETETFDDVLEVAEELYKFCKNEDSNKSSTPLPQEQNNGQSGESDSENIDTLRLESDPESSNDSEPKSETYSEPEPSNGESENNLEIKTAESLEENLKNLIGYDNVPSKYIEIPDIDIDKVIVKNSEVHEDISFGFEFQQKNHPDKCLYSNVDTKFFDFKRSAQKEVNYLVKEFECKKSANSYARATVSRTGVLDTSKLHTYKYNEDLFKKVTTLADGKNHGLIFILDWSGSMSNVLQDTLKQLYNILWFCKKVSIPFEVYTFTCEWNRPYLDLKTKEYVPVDLSPRYEQKENIFAIGRDFSLLNMFTSKVSGKELEIQMKNVWRISESFIRSYNCLYGITPRMSLSGTPLNESLVCLHKILPNFKKKNNLQKVQCIVLTDGEANPLTYHVEVKIKDKDKYIGHRRISGNGFFLRDRKLGTTYSISYGPYGWNIFTDILLRNLKDNFGDVNFVGIRVLESREVGNFIKLYYGYGNDDYDKVYLDWRKNKSFCIKKSGYDAYFGISSSALSQDSEFEVDDGASKAKIKSAFIKSLKTKKLNKKVLGEFISLVV